MVHVDTASSSTSVEDVLHDNCNEGGNGWIAPSNAVDEEAELVIDLGCYQRIISVQMKNLKKEIGGTNAFSLYIGTQPTGPWELITSGTLNETSKCTDEMEILTFSKG